jgi:[citrate (pro-3S)-lyase] ligase
MSQEKIDAKLKKHARLIAGIYGEGTSVVDWLYENGYTNVIIYVDSYFETYLPVIVSILADWRVNCGGLFSIKKFGEETNFDKYYGAASFNSIKKAELTTESIVLELTPKSKIGTNTRVKESGCTVLSASFCLENAYKTVRPLQKALQHLREKAPGCYFVQIKWPKNTSDDPCFNLTRLDLIHSVKCGKLPAHYEKYAYDPNRAAIMFMTQLQEFSGKGIAYKDYESLYVNIKNGHRVVVDRMGNNGQNRAVWMLGGCRMYGICSPDDSTIPSFLQKYLLAGGIGINVENYGMNVYKRIYTLAETYSTLPVKDGDIVISGYSFPFEADGIVEMQNRFDEVHAANPDLRLFSYTHHLTPDGNELNAQIIFQFLKENNFYANPKTRSPQSANLETYKRKLRELAVPIGAIVMNCNPFTLGHRYLIEQSAARVSQLYIFVVEEDKSVFPFADRIELVRGGTADLKNVTVLPSGKFIISQITFKDYFNKSELHDAVIDPSQDVELFGRHIAPTLGITVRFAGEEPLDNVTRQYNEAMRRILPQYGVEFVEIPRKETGGEPISASRVRKLLEEKDFKKTKELVPKTTYEYLRKTHGGG